MIYWVNFLKNDTLNHSISHWVVIFITFGFKYCFNDVNIIFVLKFCIYDSLALIQTEIVGRFA